MRTFISSIVLGLALVGLNSCDKVEQPTIVKNNSTTVGSGSTVDSVTNYSQSGFKKTLLEDYTGHKCGNCPAAARLASSLTAQYQSSLVVIAVHAGFFSKTNTQFPQSFTCTAGNDWDGSAGFNVSGQGNPNGMVNRKQYPGFQKVHKDTWATTVGLAQADPFIVKLDVMSKYDKATRGLNVETKLTFLQAYANNVKLQLVLTEDSIVAPQLDYAQVPDDYVEEYEFEHMLRGAINGSWGEVAKTAPITALSTATITNSGFAVDAAFNDKHLYLVVFAYDETTKEVLQVEKLKIRK